MNHKVLLLNAGFSLYGLIQQNPTLKQQFALLGLNFGNEVMVNDRQQLIGQISQSVKNCRLLLLVDNAPELRAREILAQGFNKPLHQDEKALQDIRKYLSQNGRMANARLQNAMIPQDAVPLSDPGCGQAGFALFFPQTCVALVSGSAKDVLRLVANQLFPLLLRQLYPGAVTADIPLRDDRVEEVEDYIDRTSSRRVSGFLPILGGSASSPVLRLIAIQEDERTSRQCCDSFLEDLTSECGKVSTIPGLGTRGLRAVEKKLGRRHEPVAAFAANTAAASAAPAAAVTAKASSLALDDEDQLYAMQEYEDNTWTTLYKQISVVNLILEQLDTRFAANPEYNRLKGESLLLRGQAYFYLVNCYAKPYTPSTATADPGVPVKLTAPIEDKDYVREPVERVYTQIVDDLTEAAELLKGIENKSIYRAGATAALRAPSGFCVA